MFNILAPIFGLIALAYASRRVSILGPNAYLELNRFVASLALPALIFDNVAHVKPEQLNQPAFTAAFGVAARSRGDVDDDHGVDDRVRGHAVYLPRRAAAAAVAAG
jgi:hypothetical protein